MAFMLMLSQPSLIACGGIGVIIPMAGDGDTHLIMVGVILPMAGVDFITTGTLAGVVGMAAGAGDIIIPVGDMVTIPAMVEVTGEVDGLVHIPIVGLLVHVPMA